MNRMSETDNTVHLLDGLLIFRKSFSVNPVNPVHPVKFQFLG